MDETYRPLVLSVSDTSCFADKYWVVVKEAIQEDIKRFQLRKKIIQPEEVPFSNSYKPPVAKVDGVTNGNQ